MSRRLERDNVEVTVEVDDEDIDGDEYLATELHRYVQFRLANMITHPEAYGKTREAVILQLMLIVEFALLTHPEADADTEASFDELLATFPDATVEPLRKPTHEWIRTCATATGAYIAMKVLAVQLAHRASCPHCGPDQDSDRMPN
jgi:hypothetical protein